MYNGFFEVNDEKLPGGTLYFYLGAYDLYFMRMAKCASGSITIWLKQHIEDIIPIQLHNIFDCTWDRSFTTIRNPFDRLVSSYKHFLHRKSIPPIMQVGGLEYIEFSEFVDRVIEVGHPEELTDKDSVKESFYNQMSGDISLDVWEYILRMHTVPLTHSFCDARRFSDIIRFENLIDDWKELLTKYTISYSPLPENNRVSGDAYWQYYDNRTRDIVTEYYKEDLLTFDYRF